MKLKEDSIYFSVPVTSGTAVQPWAATEPQAKRAHTLSSKAPRVPGTSLGVDQPRGGPSSGLTVPRAASTHCPHFPTPRWPRARLPKRAPGCPPAETPRDRTLSASGPCLELLAVPALAITPSNKVSLT